MTSNEFTAWLQGYCEHINGEPTAEQWARIMKKAESIRDDPPTVNVHHHYVPPTVYGPITIAPQYPAMPWEVTCSSQGRTQ